MTTLQFRPLYDANPGVVPNQIAPAALECGDLVQLADGRTGYNASLEDVASAGGFNAGVAFVGEVAAASGLVAPIGTEMWFDPVAGQAKTRGAAQSIAGAMRLGPLVEAKASGELVVLVDLNANTAPGVIHAETARPTLTASSTETVLSAARIPAGTLKPGTVLEFAATLIAPATNSTDTFTFRVRVGTVALTGTVVVATAATDLANGNASQITGTITILSSGASGKLSAGGSSITVAVAAAAALANQDVNTTVENFIALTAQHSTTNAGNTSVCESFVVKRIG